DTVTLSAVRAGHLRLAQTEAFFLPVLAQRLVRVVHDLIGFRADVRGAGRLVRVGAYHDVDAAPVLGDVLHGDVPETRALERVLPETAVTALAVLDPARVRRVRNFYDP